jgi:PKD repeat protein
MKIFESHPVRSNCPRRLKRASAIVFTWLAATASAQDLSTTNTNTLSHFWATAQATNQPVTVVSFGDSVADSYRSVTFSVINMMVESLGVAGYSLNNYGDATLYNLTNGAQVVTGPTALWFSDYYQLPPGGSLWWNDQDSPNGVYSDKLGVFWVAQPQGGLMTFSVSTDQGAWTPLLTLNGYAAVATGQYTNIVLAPDFHQIRVDGVSGTNYVIGPQLLLQTTSGVHVVFMDKGGIAVSDVTNVPSAIRTPIFAALSPDLLIWHMKEDGTTVTSNGLMICEQWWSNAAPACDVIYIGTMYESVDTNPATAVTVSQNTLVRYIALQYNRAYCNLMNPSISWPWMNSQGYMADGTHTTYAGGLYLARYLWYEFGFSAPGVGIPPQTVSFSASPTNDIIPLAVTFTDTSVASITNWFWDFGDGTITNLMTEVVRHTYASTGTFTVTEIITIPGGLLTNTQANYITVSLVQPSANFTAAPTNGVVPLTVTFADTSTGSIANWFWSFGDGNTTNATTNSMRHTYITPGTYSVTEIVNGPAGSSTNTWANYISVSLPPPSASFTAIPTGGVTPLTVTFADASTGNITNWFWNFGDGNTTNATTRGMQHTYATAGTYGVTEIVTGLGGFSTTTRANYITALLAAQFQAWQLQYFNCTNCVLAQLNVDADGTGQNNLFKYIAGLDPTNPASMFVLNVASGTNQSQAMNLNFNPLAIGRTYTPQFSTDLVSGVWMPLTTYMGPVTNIGGTQVTITDTNPIPPQEFYRIDISLP